MVTRHSIKISSWEKGRKVAAEISQKLLLSMEERDSTIYLLNEEETIRISFVMDSRGFTFVKAKLSIDNPEEIIIMLTEYQDFE
ncbi:MAG: hypothetical protein ACTSYA_04395 [Candidatus Kariarchaeaceae archaeon]